jgi:dihydroorotase
MIQTIIYRHKRGWLAVYSGIIGLLLLVVSSFSEAPQFDLLIKEGQVIDPKHQINAVLDIAVKEGKIVLIGPNISASDSKKVIDAQGLYVVPGLIDLHTHVFVGSKPRTFADGSSSVSPDDFTLRSGVTTVVDAGTSGWRNFPLFKSQVIEVSQTRVLAFLNIAGLGMSGSPQQEDLLDMDPEKTSQMIKEYPGILVGTKIGHYEGSEWDPFEKALEAGRLANVPLLVECHLPQYSLEDQLDRMRPGDIITHSFEKVSERMSVVDDQKKVHPFVLKAQKRGVLFDVGHGGAGFWFSEAIPALQQGLLPDSFGTDLHRFSMNAGMKSMLNVMSKYLNMGMAVEDIILRATWKPAKAIKRPDLGHLGQGAVADIALLRLKKGEFGFIDAGGNRLEGDHKFESELTIRAGRIVWDLNGLAARKLEQ